MHLVSIGMYVFWGRCQSLGSLKIHRAQSVSHQKRGECDINFEIISTQNSRFVAHDSMGFEHGHRKNFEDARTFLQSRSGDGIALKDRVHVIWYSVSSLVYR
jgi:hypothetical protein